jgi:ribonuclease-3
VFNTDKERKAYQKKIEQMLGFKPGTYDYYEMAMLHSSASANQKKGKNGHNERLEFLGDSVLDLVIADMLFHQYPEKDEGELTRMRSILVNRIQLNRIATEMGIDKLIIGSFVKNILPEDVKGNALEALIGAIYLDKGFAFTYSYVKNKIIDNHIRFHELIHDHRDYKSELFIWAQKNKQSIRFETVGDFEQDEKKRYIINVLVAGKVAGTGEGSSKKKAEQMACKNACKLLNITINK